MKFISTIVIFFNLISCSTPQGSVENLASVKKDQVVLVGRIILDPPLTPHEKKKAFNVLDVHELETKVYVKADAAPAPINENELSYFDKRAVLAKWDKIFTIPYEQHDAIYINGMYGFVYNGNSQPGFLIFPVRGYVKTDTKSKYFYIGDIILTRDEFSVLTAVKIVDNYSAALKSNSELKNMQKSLLVLQR